MLAPTGWDSPRSELQTLLELGQGGMATAYLARALGAGGFERLVVLKRLSLELLDNQEALDRFLTEARVAAQLHHANIVGTHQIGRDAEGPFIVLDYVEGGSLDELVNASSARGEKLPVPVVLRIVLDALAGLRAVHEASDGSGRPLDILHRDVSLQNVLVSVNDGVTRLSDFGVAKSSLSRIRTDPRCFVGKLLYFSPEYLLGEAVGPPHDLYGLGVTLWLALTGEELWPNQDGAHLIRTIVNHGVPSLAGRVEVAPEIQAFVARACARDPVSRFDSARAMAAELEDLDRRCGWVASYGDVATCVERLLGARLTRRRETLAELAPGLAEGRRGPEPSDVASNELARPGPAAPLRAVPVRASGPRRPRTRGRLSLTVALLVIPLLALALGSAPLSRTARPPSVARVPQITPAARGAPPLESASEPMARSGDGTVVAAAGGATPPERTGSEQRAPGQRRAAQRASGAPETSSTASGPLPQEIRRKNPYR